MNPSRICSLWVPGRPVPQGSKRPIRTKSGRMIVLDSSGERLTSWRDWLAHSVLAVLPPPWSPCARAIRVQADFDMERPKAHYRHNGAVKPSAPAAHCQRPDIDKLSRALLDALTGIVWLDDSQVDALIVRKRWARDPGVHLAIDEVRECETSTAES